jgi:hypothetical protein
MLRSTHRRGQQSCFLAIAIAVAVQQRPVAAGPAHTASPDFGAIAPAFVSNSGQTDPSARFLGVGGGRPIFLTAGDV